jgi:zinc protease
MMGMRGSLTSVLVGVIARRGALVAVGLALGIVACAGRGDPPPQGSATPAQTPVPTAGLPPPVREVLPNGLRLIVQEQRSSDIVAVYMWTSVGVRFDKPDELGYSHFMEHMLFKGTDTWGPGYFDRTVEGVGGRSNAFTTFDYTVFSVLVPREALETGVRLLADMAFRSAFASDQIAREREVIFEEARLEADQPRSAIIRQLYSLVFDGNPYGRPVLGTRVTLDGADHDRLLAYYHHYYTPENMALVVAGPVEPAAVRALVDQTFGRVPSHGLAPTPAPVPSPLTGVVTKTVERPEQQAILALGWQAPRSEDTAGDAVDLLTAILAGDESSRLSRRLRDKEQLVQSISMNYAALMGGGIVSLRTELAAKDVDRAERIIREEIEKIQQDGPSEEERRLAVIKFEADHAFDTETSEGLANAYGIAEMTWTLDAELHYVERLRHITVDQIREAARRYLSTSSYARVAFVPKPAP